jgi:hypothetical protein
MLIDATLVKNATDAMGATLILAQGMTQSFTWTDLFLGGGSGVFWKPPSLLITPSP